MEDSTAQLDGASSAIDAIRDGIEKSQSTTRRRISKKLFLAALGAIPWVGGVIAAIASISRDEADVHSDDLRTDWLEDHENRLVSLRKTLEEVEARIQSFGPEVEQRIESPEFLALVRQAFRVWDEAETEEKRQFVANLISNAAGTRLCTDDILRLFISWLALYHESHFALIREIHRNPGSTRFDVWTGVYRTETLPKEDSADADLYRMLIRDLSTGGVIRQARDTNEAHEFLRKRPARRRVAAPTTMKSAFDDKESYVLTELGKQFVHYTLMGEVKRLEATDG